MKVMNIVFWCILGLMSVLMGFHLITGKSLIQDVLGCDTEKCQMILSISWLGVMIILAGFLLGLWQFLIRLIKKK